MQGDHRKGNGAARRCDAGEREVEELSGVVHADPPRGGDEPGVGRVDVYDRREPEKADAGALTAASVLVGWRRPSRAKQQAYECGMEPTGDAREPFSVKFYLVAMVFILFDVEAIFLYPWAYIYRDMVKQSIGMGRYGFFEMLIYIAILLVGYIYLWKKGAFDWHK